MYLLCALSVAGESRTISRHIIKVIRSNRGGNCERNNITKMSRVINHWGICFDVKDDKMIYVEARQLSANYVALVLSPVRNRFGKGAKTRSIITVVVLCVFPSTLHPTNSPFSTSVCSHRYGAHKIQTKPR